MRQDPTARRTNSLVESILCENEDGVSLRRRLSGSLIMNRFCLVALMCAGLLVAVGCLGLDDGPRDGTSPSFDVRPPDLGASNDLSLPPLPPGYGSACDPSVGQCADGLLCVPLRSDKGVCVVADCTLENVMTPEREDTCPTSESVATVCSRVSVGLVQRNVCLKSCAAQLNLDSCNESPAKPDLVCDPRSALLNGQQPVCLHSACKADSDCGPLGPTPQTCDLPTGVCRGGGTSAGAVGDPCVSDAQCGANQACFVGLGGFIAPGGYCTVIGCRLGGPWACPEGSTCVDAGLLDLCLVSECDTQNVVCREGYSCIAVGKQQVCWLTAP